MSLFVYLFNYGSLGDRNVCNARESLSELFFYMNYESAGIFLHTVVRASLLNSTLHSQKQPILAIILL